jgi:hypothetical protein
MANFELDSLELRKPTEVLNRPIDQTVADVRIINDEASVIEQKKDRSKTIALVFAGIALVSIITFFSIKQNK